MQDFSLKYTRGHFSRSDEVALQSAELHCILNSNLSYRPFGKKFFHLYISCIANVKPIPSLHLICQGEQLPELGE